MHLSKGRKLLSGAVSFSKIIRANTLGGQTLKGFQHLMYMSTLFWLHTKSSIEIVNFILALCDAEHNWFSNLYVRKLNPGESAYSSCHWSSAKNLIVELKVFAGITRNVCCKNLPRRVDFLLVNRCYVIFSC